MKSKLMAWYKYPEPDGREYLESDLEKESSVEELFNYSQLQLTLITKHGWKKLVLFHGIEKLLNINKKSGWFEDDFQEAIDSIKYNCLISGYDPEQNIFGNYNEESNIFTDENGNNKHIKWGFNWTHKT